MQKGRSLCKSLNIDISLALALLVLGMKGESLSLVPGGRYSKFEEMRIIDQRIFLGGLIKVGSFSGIKTM